MAQDIHSYLDRRKQSPYLKKNTNKSTTPSPQEPKRMWKPKKANKTIDDLFKPGANPTDEELSYALAPKEIRDRYDKIHGSKSEPGREHLVGLELINRHRYGDDVDILRATFTRTREEVEQEKSILVRVSRELLGQCLLSLQRIPKHEKYVLGAYIRDSCYNILKHAVAIKRRYYRKNMLEFVDIELDVLRENYLLAHTWYPEWIDDAAFYKAYEAINQVGAIVGGLLKTTVA